MHHNDVLTLQRIDRLFADRLRRHLYRATAQLEVAAWEVPGEPVDFSDAVTREFTPFCVGAQWGRPWGTVWFHVTGAVPPAWRNEGRTSVELVVDLGFDASAPGFQAEALVYSADGRIVKAIEPRNATVRIDSDVVDFFIEAAGNPSVAGTFTFEPTPLGDVSTAGTEPLYRLTRLELALLDREVWELGQDVWTLRGLVDQLDPGRTRRARVIDALANALDALDPDDVAGTASAARACLIDVLAAPAASTSHTVTAVGHAHIDSAWLWPVRETVRKVARTFSNVLELAAREPDLVFGASSAQQYLWIKERYPALFERLRTAIAAGQFVPLGGMWVESDTNMPGGEALARQLIEGKRFFIDEFGVEPMEVWLPDSFGYSAAMPQIISAAGSRWFLTQKISWNETNRMPHHTFLWEGIDGTRVFTHFPPVDTYNSELSAAELAHAEREFAEKRHASHSLVPFGWGDGGGGPTREMIAAARRTADLEGSPRVRLAAPEVFFRDAEAEYPNPPVWEGELYLEYHRGSFSAQARTKRGNRRAEHLLRAAELWCTVATLRAGATYPYDRLRGLWRRVLLHQFHDILPGTSIAWVHQEAERAYSEIISDLEEVISNALATVVGSGTQTLVANAAPVAIGGTEPLAVTVDCDPPARPKWTRTDAGWVSRHPRVRWTIDDRGVVIGGHDWVADREIVDPEHPIGVLQITRDTPRDWDAWNIDLEDRTLSTDLLSVTDIVAADATVTVTRAFGRSSVLQTFRVDPDTGPLDIDVRLDWHERQKMLKIAFPVDVRADRFESEIQFGHVSRPVHANTSWDAARFETVAHRWIRLVEGNYGLAIANDASYGHDVHRDGSRSGGRGTVARVTLVRAPLFPDPSADQGEHTFRLSVLPSASVDDAIGAGFRLNMPHTQIRGGATAEPLLTIGGDGVVIEAVKLANDESGDVIVRLYESTGSRRGATITTAFALHAVEEVDLLERTIQHQGLRGWSGDEVSLELRPFQIVTLRLAGNADEHRVAPRDAVR